MDPELGRDGLGVLGERPGDRSDQVPQRVGASAGANPVVTVSGATTRAAPVASTHRRRQSSAASMLAAMASGVTGAGHRAHLERGGHERPHRPAPPAAAAATTTATAPATHGHRHGHGPAPQAPRWRPRRAPASGRHRRSAAAGVRRGGGRGRRQQGLGQAADRGGQHRGAHRGQRPPTSPSTVRPVRSPSARTTRSTRPGARAGDPHRVGVHRASPCPTTGR